MNLLTDFSNAKLYTIKEAVEKTGLSDSTIRRAIKDRELKTIQIGKGTSARHFIRESALQEWLRSRVREG